MKGIQAALEMEYDYGAQTTLKERVAERFGVENPKNMISRINQNQETPASIASVAKIVFEEANNGDRVSQNIISEAANSLGHLLYQALKQTDVDRPEIYLIGGLFKSEQADEFIQMMYNCRDLQKIETYRRPRLINVASSNITEEVVKRSMNRLGKARN